MSSVVDGIVAAAETVTFRLVDGSVLRAARRAIILWESDSSATPQPSCPSHVPRIPLVLLVGLGQVNKLLVLVIVIVGLMWKQI